MQNPKVSIVIPVYNGSNYLGQAIDSALAQTYNNIEVLVINDGSNDDGRTEIIAKSYGEKISYFYKLNGGVASAMNLGIKQMTGEYFSWLSHDDLYYPHKVEAQITYIKKYDNKNTVIYTDREFIDEQGRTIESPANDERYLSNSILLVLSTFLHGCSLLIPKEAFNKVGLFNESLRNTQDIEMWFRLVKAGYKFKFLSKVMVQGRIHSHQTTLLTHNRHAKEQKDFYLWALDSIDTEFLLKYRDDILKILFKKNQPEAIRHLHTIMKENLSFVEIVEYTIKTQCILFATNLRDFLRGSSLYIEIRNWIRRKLFANSS